MEWANVVLLVMGVAAIAAVCYVAVRISLAVIDYAVTGERKRKQWWKGW